jgi:hypothetical protein
VRVALHPEARTEIRLAALWYEERRPGLGDEFTGGVDEVLGRIAHTPGLYPVWPGTPAVPIPIRKASLEQFPYLVAFEVHPQHLLVLAVAHAKRRPLYWLARASQRTG